MSKMRFREGIRLLENHPDLPPEQYYINIGSVYVLIVQVDFPLQPAFLNEVIHAVEASEKGALSTAGRTYEGCHVVLVNVESDILQRMEIPIIEIHSLCRYFGFLGHCMLS